MYELIYARILHNSIITFIKESITDKEINERRSFYKIKTKVKR